MMIFFVFKQKTAYEMRISDWSSDVCSSDLMFLHLIGRCLWQFGTKFDEARYPETWHIGIAERPDLVGIQLFSRLNNDDDLHLIFAEIRFCRDGRALENCVEPQEDIFNLVRGDILAASANGILFRSEEPTSELQSLMRNSYAVFCLKKKKQ